MRNLYRIPSFAAIIGAKEANVGGIDAVDIFRICKDTAVIPGALPQHALLVTFDAPLDRDPALAQSAAAAFTHLTPLRPIALTFAGVHQDVYDVVQLDDPRANARTMLPGL